MDNVSKLQIEIIKTDIEEERGKTNITSKILFKNNTNHMLSFVDIEARFYDENKNLVDLDKQIITNIRPNSESVEILHFFLNSDNIESYGLRPVDARIKNS